MQAHVTFCTEFFRVIVWAGCAAWERITVCLYSNSERTCSMYGAEWLRALTDPLPVTVAGSGPRVTNLSDRRSMVLPKFSLVNENRSERHLLGLIPSCKRCRVRRLTQSTTVLCACIILTFLHNIFVMQKEFLINFKLICVIHRNPTMIRPTPHFTKYW